VGAESDKTAVLIAGEENEWREELREFLSASHDVYITENGTELAAALMGEDERGIRSIVIGERLKELSAQDAMYRARRASRARAGTVGAVLLITDVREDRDLLNFYRRRGADVLCAPGTEAEEVHAKLSEILYKDQRIQPRYACNFDGTIVLESDRLDCSVVDLSLSGALASFKAQPIDIKAGEECQLIFRSASNELEVTATAVICNVSTARVRLRKRTRLGIRFIQLDDSDKEALEQLIKRLEEGKPSEDGSSSKSDSSFGTAPF
jgi:hypothetical protein